MPCDSLVEPNESNVPVQEWENGVLASSSIIPTQAAVLRNEAEGRGHASSEIESGGRTVRVMAGLRVEVVRDCV